MNILLLEKSKIIVGLLQRTLKTENTRYQFRVTKDREDFVREVTNTLPDIIIAGNLPAGFEVMEALRFVNGKSLNIPFIIVTRGISAKLAADLIRMGADEYIPRQDLSRLPDAIEDALSRRRIPPPSGVNRQSEQNLKAIFESASEFFILATAEGQIEDFNNNAKTTINKIAGKTIEKGESIFDFIEDLRKDMFASLLEQIAKGKVVEYDRLYHIGTQKSFWVNFSFSPVLELDAFRGVCITGRDITYKKIDEQNQQFERNNLHALINNTSDLIWSVDLQLKLITANQAFDAYTLAMSGASPVRGQSIFHRSMSEKKVQDLTELYNRAFAGESFTHTDHSLSPVEYWAEILFYPIYEESKVIGTACFSRDITERKKAENAITNFSNRISSILNTIPANIALLDEFGTIIEVNDSWRKFADLNGFQGPDYCLNENYLAACRNATGEERDDGQKVAKGIENVIGNKVKEFVLEYPCFAPDAKKWYRLVATPLRETPHSGAVVMHIDVSEIRRLQEQSLKQTAEEQKKITRAVLRGQEKERTRLGQDLHDNISQLLAAIKMKLGFYLRQPDASRSLLEECEQYVLEALTEARKLSHKMVLPRFEENGFLNSFDSLLQKYQKPEQSIRVEKSRFDEKEISGEVKETLYRIVQEQLNNIEKYAKASEVFIQLLTYSKHFSLLIKDNGMGFNLKTRSRGIGLANIKNRAESFNGSAMIISSPGKGCSLLVDIPLLTS